MWQGWQPATCMPDGCFCEAIRQGLIAQPANFWSSFAFVPAGALLWVKGASRLYAVALFAVGAGSAFYHASLTLAGQVADVAGMYCVAALAILYALQRSRKISGGAVVLWFAAAVPPLIWVQVEFAGVRRYVFAALIVGVLIAERGSQWRPQFKRALLAFAIGFAFWAVDLSRIACAPNGLLQGHAVWHTMGAAAAWLLFQPHPPVRKI